MDKDFCQNCVMQMEEETNTYEVLQFLHILDNVLKYVDLKSLKPARLVCKNWNDRAILIFPNKFNLLIPPVCEQEVEVYASDDQDSESSDGESSGSWEGRQGGADVERSDPKTATTPATRLTNADVRLLTSLRVCENWNEEYEASNSNTITQTIRCLTESNLTSVVKHLDIKWVNVEQLEDFVLALQTGLSRNLEYLSITGYGGNVRKEWRFQRNILPNLRSMRIQTANKLEDEDEAATLNDHRLFYQSLVQAAPNLETLETAVGIPLGKMSNLKQLSVFSDWSEDTGDGTLTTNTHIFWKPLFDMLDSLKQNLVFLDVSCLEFRPLVPVLQNLKELRLSFLSIRGEERDEEPEDDDDFFTAFPNLTKLTLDFSDSGAENDSNWLTFLLNWATSSSKLKELQLLYLPIPNARPRKGWEEESIREEREMTRSMLHEVLNMSANVPRVVVRMDRNVHIAELLRVLRPIEVRERIRIKGEQVQKVLEFQNGHLYSPGWKISKRLKTFPNVVTNLMRNWDHADFKYFRVKHAQADKLMPSIEKGSAEIYYQPTCEQ